MIDGHRITNKKLFSKFTLNISASLTHFLKKYIIQDLFRLFSYFKMTAFLGAGSDKQRPS